MSDFKSDENQIEEECRLVGGPYDGQVIELARDRMEFALPIEAASLVAELEDMAADLTRLAGQLDASTTEEDILDALDSDPDDDKDEYAEPAPGGVLYRRGDDGRTFHFVGHISVEELDEWQRKH